MGVDNSKLCGDDNQTNNNQIVSTQMIQKQQLEQSPQFVQVQQNHLQVLNAPIERSSIRMSNNLNNSMLQIENFQQSFQIEVSPRSQANNSVFSQQMIYYDQNYMHNKSVPQQQASSQQFIIHHTPRNSQNLSIFESQYDKSLQFGQQSQHDQSLQFSMLSQYDKSLQFGQQFQHDKSLPYGQKFQIDKQLGQQFQNDKSLQLGQQSQNDKSLPFGQLSAVQPLQVSQLSQQIQQEIIKKQQVLYQQEEVDNEENKKNVDALIEIRQQYLLKIQEEMNKIAKSSSLTEPLLPMLHQYFIYVSNGNSETTDDPYHGEVYILQNKFNPAYKLCLKVQTFSDQKSWSTSEQSQQLHKQQFSHPHLLNTHIIYSRKFLCLCSTTYHLCTLLDHVTSSNMVRHFYEDEVCCILDSMVDALYALQLKGLAHQNISLGHIVTSRLIDNSLVYKLIYKNDEPPLFNKIQKLRQTNKSIVYQDDPYYMCPQKWDLGINGTEIIFDNIKSDVFSFGMLLIHICLGPGEHQQLQDIYKGTHLDVHQLQIILQQLKQNHSHHIIKIISNMITIKQTDRPDWIQLSWMMNDLRAHKVFNQNFSSHFSIYSLEVQQLVQKQKIVTPRRSNNKSNNIGSEAISIGFQQSRRSKAIIEVPSIFSDYETIKKQDDFEEVALTMIEKRTQKKIEMSDCVYDGEMVNCMRDGIGQAIFSDGSLFDGCWRHDQPNGQGVLYSMVGVEVYRGNFVGGQYGGFGCERNTMVIQQDFSFDDFTTLASQWSKYSGDFVEGKWHGFGCLELISGERYVGAFTYGLPNGVGVFHTSNRECINGHWSHGHLIKRLMF